MSRRDYQALAAVIREVAATGGDPGTCLAFAERMARVFAADNSNFSREVFYRAAGFEVGYIASDNADLSAGSNDPYPIAKGGA
jgi:hypothetical protein